MSERQYFQDYMASKNCFGCGIENHQGFNIRSYWDESLSVCEWQAKIHHEGWSGLTCGGVISTLVDCHAIATAMATAFRNEDRDLGSDPQYTFATGSLNVVFLKPTPIDSLLRIEASVVQIKYEKKYTVKCDVYSVAKSNNGDDNLNDAGYVTNSKEKVAEAQVVALLVYRSDRPDEAPDAFR